MDLNVAKSLSNKTNKIEASDIISVFNTFLDRDPESTEVILNHLNSKNLIDLCYAFATSTEFRERSINKYRNILPLNIINGDVDIVISPEEMSACINIVQKTWEHLGLVRPHFSVLTNDNFMPQNFEKYSEDFWDSAYAEINQLIQTITNYGLKNHSELIYSELGGGVGRITTSISKFFKICHGYDISYNHINLAKSRCELKNIKNCNFITTADSPLQSLIKSDVIYSNIVLQHNPPPIIYALVKNILSSLNNGGVAIFQVPTYYDGYHFSISEYLKKNHKLDMQMHCIPKKYIFDLIAEFNCRLLDVREDNSIGMLESSISNIFVIQKIN
jgi:trans-aconitate methyltransferase